MNKSHARDFDAASYRSAAMSNVSHKTARVSSQLPIESKFSGVNGRVFTQEELNHQIMLKMGGPKGIGMTEDEWNKQVLQNKANLERENTEKKRKMDEDRQKMREMLNEQVEYRRRMSA